MTDTLSHRARWAALVVVCFAQFMVILDATIINVALPSIQTDLDLSPEPAVDRQFLHAALRRLPAARRPRGRPPRPPRLFIAGVALFTLASLLNGLATSGPCSSWPARCRASAPRWSPPRRCRSSPPPSTRAPTARRRSASGARSPAGGGAVGLLLGGILTDLCAGSGSSSSTCPIGIGVAFAALRWVPESRQEMAAPALRPRRRGLGHRGPRRPRLRDRQGAGLRAGARRARSACRARARPACHLRRSSSAARRRRWCASRSSACARSPRPTRAPPRRRRPLRDVLLRVALRAADPRVLAAEGRAGLPAGHRGDRHRRRAGAVLHPRFGVEPTRSWRWRSLPPASGARGDDEGRRLLPGHPLPALPDVGGNGLDLRAAHARRHDGHRARRRRPRLGAVQHLPAGRRCPGARRPLDAGQPPHGVVPQRSRPCPDAGRARRRARRGLPARVHGQCGDAGRRRGPRRRRAAPPRPRRIDTTQPVMVGA